MRIIEATRISIEAIAICDDWDDFYLFWGLIVDKYHYFIEAINYIVIFPVNTVIVIVVIVVVKLIAEIEFC